MAGSDVGVVGKDDVAFLAADVGLPSWPMTTKRAASCFSCLSCAAGAPRAGLRAASGPPVRRAPQNWQNDICVEFGPRQRGHVSVAGAVGATIMGTAGGAAGRAGAAAVRGAA